MKRDLEKTFVFGVSPDAKGGFALLVGIPEKAWQEMRTGIAKDMDLGSLGLPIKLMIYGGKDHAECLKVIHDHNKKQGLATLDERRTDFSIKPHSVFDESDK